MKELLLTTLRNRNTTRVEFRHAANQLAHILASEMAAMLPREKFHINTPIAPFEGVKLAQPVILVPILRSGLALLPAFIEFFPDAAVGCIGLKRDEATAEPRKYYENMPPIGKHDRVIMLDPMIATGGSSIAAIKMVMEMGVQEERITFAAVIASEPGLKKVQAAFPKIKFLVPAVDKELTSHYFITPGLGDFGDRFFGTL